MRKCLRCKDEFGVCRSCDHGQRYCSDACREPARREQRREARQRHQQSEEGRLDHRDHQAAYRERQRETRVTDQGSEEAVLEKRLGPLDLAESSLPDEKEPGSEILYVWCPEKPCCRFCGRETVFLEWG